MCNMMESLSWKRVEQEGKESKLRPKSVACSQLTHPHGLSPSRWFLSGNEENGGGD